MVPSGTPLTPAAPSGGTSTLDEASRRKLDGIVQQMVKNGETDSYIQNVVNDFKAKYAQSPVSKVAFQSPLENIRAGNSQTNLQVGAGAIKRAVSDVSSVGAQNAGPVGAEMMRGAPEFAKNIDAFNAEMTPATPAEVQGAANTVVAEFAPAVITAPRAIASAARRTPDFLKRITGVFKGKTMDEILSTPIDDLHKLSAADRNVYFDAQRAQAHDAHVALQEQIDRGFAQAEKNIKAQSEANIAALNNETQGLINKVDRASLEEAQSLKPKVIQSMVENSNKYRSLINEEIGQVRDEPISHDKLMEYITSRNLDNPAKATEITGRLGLDKGKVSTIGQVYDQIKGLKQDIGKAATKGSRVYTPDEVKINDAISTLSDYLKSERGIDFSAANKFWSRYAPMRDKLIRTVQPFTPRGAESATFNTFSKDIQNYVAGVKEGKVDFIKATEKLLGEKIGNPETRAALENLSANQKAKIAADFEQKNQIALEKLLQEQKTKLATETLTAKQNEIAAKEFEAARKAQTRKNIWRAIGAVTGGIVGLEELKRLIGL